MMKDLHNVELVLESLQVSSVLLVTFDSIPAAIVVHSELISA